MNVTRGTATSAGAWEVKRVIRLPALEGAADATRAREVLAALPGVLEVETDLERRRLTVRYDSSRLDYRTLASTLEGVGLAPAGGLLGRIRASLWQYADTNARENAKAPPPPCCNKPPR